MNSDKALRYVPGTVNKEVIVEKKNGVDKILRLFLSDGSELRVEAVVNAEVSGDPGTQVRLDIMRMID
jgi:hypothetical protein